MERKRAIAGNTGTGWLKLLALVFMLCDHMGKMLFPGVPEMRMLGRIAFPLYAWGMVVGFHYTRSVPKYILRLAVIGLISQPLYMAALNHTLQEPNIFLTLLLALCAMWGVREKRWGSQFLAPAAALALAVWLKCDYGWRGVLLILLLYAVQDSKAGIAAVMTAFCLFWGANSSAIVSLFGQTVSVTGLPVLGPLVSPWLRLQALAILALPLMLCSFRRPLKLPGWVGYALYPAHLLSLLLLERLM